MEHFDTVFGIVAGVIGVSLIIKGIYDRVKAIKFIGTIVDYVRETNGYYYPMVEFQYNGQKYTMSVSDGEKSPKDNIGKELKILYLPNNQKCVMVQGKYGDILIGVAMVGFCVIYLCKAFM